MKYVHYNEKTKQIIGWYYKDIHGEDIPKPNLEVDDSIWQEAIDNNHNYVDIDKKSTFFKEPTISLKTLKETKKAEIDKAKEEAEYADFTYNGITIQADAKSQANLTSAMLGMVVTQSSTLDWVTADNQIITLSAEQITAIAMALKQRTQGIVFKGRLLKDAVESATKKAEVEAIKWEA